MTDDLVKRLRSQIGDDVQEVYLHEALFGLAADRIEALTEQLEDAYVRGFCAGQRALKVAGELVTIDSPEIRDRIEALTAELAEEKRMRQEEKAKILRQREQLDSIQKANRNNLPMRRGLQRRVAELEGAEADNARLRAELTKAADSLDWADAHLEDAGVVSANVRYGARDARAAVNPGKETK